VTEHTTNELFLTALLVHQIGLMRLSGSIRNEVIRIIDDTEPALEEAIQRVLSKSRGLSSPADVRRLRNLMAEVRTIRLDAMAASSQVWSRRLTELALAEPRHVDGALKTVSLTQLTTTLPTSANLRSIVRVGSLEGRTLGQWASQLVGADLRRIEAQIRIGLVQGEDVAAITRRVVGTSAMQSRDGVLGTTRREVGSITRTVVNAVANAAKRLFYVGNSDLFSSELYVATLDSRTTPICRALDGKTFPVGEGPIPPLHHQCRSLRVAVLDGGAIGSRPAKSSTEAMLLREFTATNKLPSAKTRDALPRGTKGQFDLFKRQRVRELTGTVPARVDYQTWLTSQSAEFQDDVLGKARGRLFRTGKLRLDRFVNRSGDEIPLSRLARTERRAFIAAGLDPENFALGAGWVRA